MTTLTKSLPRVTRVIVDPTAAPYIPQDVQDIFTRAVLDMQARDTQDAGWRETVLLPAIRAGNAAWDAVMAREHEISEPAIAYHLAFQRVARGQREAGGEAAGAVCGCAVCVEKWPVKGKKVTA